MREFSNIHKPNANNLAKSLSTAFTKSCRVFLCIDLTLFSPCLFLHFSQKSLLVFPTRTIFLNKTKLSQLSSMEKIEIIFSSQIWESLFLPFFKLNWIRNEQKKKRNKNDLPSRLMPTAMHFFRRQYWQRLRLMRKMLHCWFLVHGRYWIFCWIDRLKNPCLCGKYRKKWRKLID